MRLLLVDDHVLFRAGLALLLRPALDDATILEAGTCAEAFAVLARDGPVDLILMDLQMPGMPGLDGIAHVRERHPDVPVVALSSSDDRDTVLSALDAGAMGFIPKSSTSAVLLSALRLILAKGIYLPPSAFLADRAQPPPPAARGAGTKEPAELGLTQRQSDVLYRILQGKPAKVICRELGLSTTTVKVHTSAVLRALNVTTRTQAVIAAGRLGLRFPER